MGKRNRERRRQKQQRRQRQAARRGSPPPCSHGQPSGAAGAAFGLRDADGLLCDAAMAFRERDEAVLVLTLKLLAEGWRSAPAVTAGVVGHRLLRAVAEAWEHGWQPTDLPRLMTRKLGAAHGRLVQRVIVTEAAGYRDRPGADPAWMAQIDALGSSGADGGAAGLIGQPQDVEEAIDCLGAAAALLSLLWHLPCLPRLMDPPGSWGRGAPRRSRAAPEGVDAKVLGRVRALLAKAESTTYPEEAEALTAKAHQLMSRHAIDRAVVDASEPAGAGGPVGRRIATEDPYAAAKSLLLSEVACASRCRAVWSRDLGFSTVFGYPGDLDAVELLYTSLLVQATRAMLAAGQGAAGSRSRSRGFRQSFLTAFAHRIGQRLREARDTAESDATASHGAALLPVLASRLDAVDQACDEAFPDMESRSISVSDGAGWAAGTAAAQLASLATGPELLSQAARAAAASDRRVGRW